MTEREIEVLSLLMKLDLEWPKDDLDYKNVISTACRKYIMRTINMKKSNLNGYIDKLVKKGVLVRLNKRRSYINPMFMPKDINDVFEVSFIIDFKE